MEYLVNDLSFHGQFEDTGTFRAALGRLMAMRAVAKRYGREVHVHHNLKHAMATRQLTVPQAAAGLTREQRSALVSWVNQEGPFWEDARAHGPDEYLQCGETLVTDTAVGEAGFCRVHGIDRTLMSVTPSEWTRSPLSVEWIQAGSSPRAAEVTNFWDPTTLQAALQAAPPPIASWRQLEAAMLARCTNLVFAKDAFAPAFGHPFSQAACGRIAVILDAVHELKGAFDANGRRTPRGHELYDNYCTGKKGDGCRGAMIKDSSDTEKATWQSELTFAHPGDPRRKLFCPWHGAVQTPQWRVHFSWPVRADEPMYIVYVGPKITV